MVPRHSGLAMQEVQQRAALITGAAGDISLGMARAFSAAGARMMLADMETAPLQRAEVPCQGKQERLTQRQDPGGR